IQADDWRALTAAVVDLARATLGSDHAEAAQPHEHPDQVTVGWLDPGLRTVVQRGPIADPAVEVRIGALERNVDRLAARLGQLNGTLGEVRDRATEVATKDLLRANDVAAVRRTVEGMADARDD